MKTEGISVIDYIPEGKDKAVSRKYLATVTGMSDRQVRSEIQSLRENGTVIISRDDGKGYFIPTPDDREELNAWIGRERSRMISIRDSINAALECRESWG